MRTKTAATTGMGQTLRVVAARLQDETDDLVETMLVRMRDEAPGFDTASRPELAEGLRASCYGNIRAALQALGGDRQPPRNSPPEAMNSFSSSRDLKRNTPLGVCASMEPSENMTYLLSPEL